jgi:hypothetical protein
MSKRGELKEGGERLKEGEEEEGEVDVREKQYRRRRTA